MEITFDPVKRDLTLKHRGLDFARAGEVFAGHTATVIDSRFDYGETRFITGGHLDDRLVVFGLDATWRSSPHHFNEALSCQGRRSLAPPHGPILTMRRP
jgi:uncharacterized DUF497 family protein